MSARLLEMGPKEHGFVQVHVGQKRRRTWMDLALIEDEPDLYPERM